MEACKHILKCPIIGFAHHRILLNENGKPIDYEYIEVNESFEKITGLNNVVGKTVRQILPGIENSEFNWIEFCGKIALEGGEVEFEQYSELLGRWYRLYIYSLEKMYFTAMFIDITESKKASIELAKAKEDAEEIKRKLNEAQEIAKLGNWELDLINNQLYWSDEIYRIFEINPEEFGASYEAFLDTVHPEDREIVNNTFTESLKNKTNYCIEHRLLMKDGKVKYVREQGKSFYDANGKPIRSIGTVQDITERKHTEELLRSLSAAVEQSPASIIITDTKGYIEYVNSKFSELTGYTYKEAVGKRPSILKSGYQTDDVYKELWGTISSGKEWKGELVNQKKNGELYWDFVHISPIFDDNGNITHYLSVQQDITERKKLEEELKESERRFRTLAENAQDIIYRYELKPVRRYAYISPAAYSITGYTPEEHYSDPDLGIKIVHENDRQLFEEYFKGNGTFGKPLVLRWRRKDGSIIWMEQRNVAIRDENGELIAIEGIVRDITESKNIEEQLKKINQELELAINEKDKFFSIIAHDLRSPFTAFLNLTKIMSEQITDLSIKEVQEFSNELRSSAENLYKLLENLLSWSRLKRNLMHFNPEALKLDEIILTCAYMLKGAIEIKNQNFEIMVPSDIYVYADRQMLDTVFRNLVTNASKFTSKNGSISINAEIIDDYVQISVADTGIGIPEDLKEKLFDIGVKTSRKGTDGEPSSGLGLILCKEFVEKNGGSIWVKSKEGEGSTFYFTVKHYKNTI